MIDFSACSREFITEFIKIYKDNECLWKIKSKDYMNKQSKTIAYNVLAEKLKEVDANANIETVRKKINSLRSNYRKELIKVENSKNNHQPTLWYFHLFDFIGDQKILTRDLSKRQLSVDYSDQIDTEEIMIPIKQQIDTDQEIFSEDTTSLIHHHNQSSETTHCHFHEINPVSEADTTGFSKLSSENILDNSNSKLNEDKFDSFGKHIAHQLREMNSKDQIYAQKFINDIIFEVQCGNAFHIKIKTEANEAPSDQKLN